ncbi:hypothetical protein BKI52_09455 [marine bacterium AO1-C]|nr:hypothetical protein BKI52_09455 [marine bacterium AO1-C]
MKKILKQNHLKVLTALFLLSLGYLPAQAQKFKMALGKIKKVKVEGVNGSIYVEEYDGSEILITSPDHGYSDKTKGLKILGAAGNDNTSVGMNYKKEGNTIVFRGIRRKKQSYYFKLPKGTAFMARERGLYSNKLEIKNFSGEIEIDVAYTRVTLDNITGPVLLNATYKGPKVVFSKVNQNKPSSIVCPYGDIDVTIPGDTKANIIASSSYGDIYTNLDIKVNGSEKRSKVRGTLNGGGVEIEVRSPYKNVYIRKK